MPEDVPLRNETQADADDRIIGVAFRWSLVALLLLALLGGGMVWYLKKRPNTGFTRLTRLGAPVSPEAMAGEIPKAGFRDITAEAGIRFLHNNGAYGEKLLPETMGSGVAFLDFDNDGDQDLLFVNSAPWPWKDSNATNAGSATSALYRNDGSGRFEDVTRGSGLEVSLYGMGVAIGDYDNDSYVDVFLTALGENRLFHNERNGRFKDVTSAAGIVTRTNDWSTSAAWIDIENDGDLDLFVCNYVQWSREIDLEVDYRLVGIGRAYGPPMNFPGSFPVLYRNDGRGRFADISERAGVQIKNPATGVPMAKSLAVAPVDVNGDNFMDLVVANDTVQNFLFTNRHDGTFDEIGARSGIAFDIYGQTRGAMGIDSARFRNDSALGIAIGNFANEPNALYVSQQDSVIFADEAIAEGVGPASRLLLKFGLFFFDYDLDGRLDVLTANGHLEEDIGKIQRSQKYRQPAQLFWNRGVSSSMSFVTVPPEKCGDDLFKPIVGRGSAFADIDNDGDLDVVMTQVGGPPLLLRNEQKLGHNWLRLKLVGARSNRDAIGAWIRVRVADQTLSRQVMPARSYLSQSELPVSIGLGKATRIDTLEVLWPSGFVQRINDPKLNGTMVVQESH
jgi:enediyne biosynthesis protein E4